MQQLTLARHAMATRFEFVLAGDDPVRLRAAGEEALEEIERLDSQLSLYNPGSEIARVNAAAAVRPVRVSPDVFRLLSRAQALAALCDGAFDITVAPLVRCWGFMKGSGERPTDGAISEAMALVGIENLELDERASTVFLRKPGMMLDLGAIGKGYALDLATQILQETGVSRFLLHGGTSTILGMGTDAEGVPWKIAIQAPEPLEAGAVKEPRILTVVELHNEALSVSAISGKFFLLEGTAYGHVINPRTGWPVNNALLGAAVTNSATDSDGLSTAVLLGSDADLHNLQARIPALKYLHAQLGTKGELQVLTRGFETDPGQIQTRKSS